MTRVNFASNAEAMLAASVLTSAQRGALAYVEDEDGFGFEGPNEIVTLLAGVNIEAAELRQRKNELLAQVNAKRDSVLTQGYEYDFGAAGVRTLDNRNEQDAVNWLGLERIVEKMIAAGQGTALVQIRDAGNDTFSAPAQAVSDALFAMAQWRSAVLAQSWQLKDLIEAAGADDLPTIDIDSGWPIPGSRTAA